MSVVRLPAGQEAPAGEARRVVWSVERKGRSQNKKAEGGRAAGAALTAVPASQVPAGDQHC